MSHRSLGIRSPRRSVVVAALALGIAAASTSAGLAATTARSPQAGGSVARAASVAAAVTPVTCNGGVLKKSATIHSNAFQLVNVGAPQSLSTVPLTFTGPATGTDALLVTFSAETQLRGNTDNSQFDWIEGEVTLDGAPMTDIGPDQLALTGSSTYSSNAFQACVRVGPGTHKLMAKAGVVTNGTSVGEQGWIDDWVLRADVLE